MDRLVRPTRLRLGDTVGIISPSAGVAHAAPHRVDRACAALRSKGFQVAVGKHALGARGHVAGTVAERVADLHEMFDRDDVHMVMCTIGGNHCNQLLRAIDFDLIRANPKAFVGYSDITVLHMAIHSQAGLATFMGPCAMTQFGEYPEIFQYTWDAFAAELVAGYETERRDVTPAAEWTDELLDWFTLDDLKRARRSVGNRGYEWLRPGIARGPAWGGTVPAVNHLAGTPFWTDPSGCVFFLDVLKTDRISVENVESFFADLVNAGVFDKVSGVVVGRPSGYSAEETRLLKEILKRCVEERPIPVLFGADIGHTDPILTVRYGREVELDSTQDLLRFWGP